MSSEVPADASTASAPQEPSGEYDAEERPASGRQAKYAEGKAKYAEEQAEYAGEKQQAPDTAPDTAVGEEPSMHEEATDLAAEVEALRAELEAQEAVREELNDQLLRKAAELQNYRRRAREEIDRRTDSSKAETLRPMLEVLDDLERALAAADETEKNNGVEAAYESLRSGMEMVGQKFLSQLQRMGVEPIEAEGQPFDEQEHEAMMRQPAPEDVDPGTVMHVIRKGYRIGDRVLRHSRVVVAD